MTLTLTLTLTLSTLATATWDSQRRRFSIAAYKGMLGVGLGLRVWAR